MGTLQQKILDDVETKIRAGIWKPGWRLPAENEFEELYSCSRMTVSKALTALAERGMIVRRRGSGSFVAAPQSDRTIMEIQDIEKDAKAAGQDYKFEITERGIGRC